MAMNPWNPVAAVPVLAKFVVVAPESGVVFHGRWEQKEEAVRFAWGFWEGMNGPHPEEYVREVEPYWA